MRSLTARLTLWYALIVTATLGGALAAGGWLLREQMIHGADLLNDAEYEEIHGRLGPDSHAIDAGELAGRIREHTEIDAALYFFQVHDAARGVIFRSANLGPAILPDLGAGRAAWTGTVPPHGRLRISEYRSGPWHVQIASSLDPMDRLLRNYTRVAGALMAVIALASVLLGYAFSRYALGPVGAIAATARRINADNLGERIPAPRDTSELADLARLLNGMFDRLEASFAHARRFSADVSHELKTPLALVRLNAEKLRPRVAADPEAAALVDDLVEDAGRMHALIERLLFLAKAESGTLTLALQPQDPAAIVRDFAEDAGALAEDAGARFELEVVGPGRPVGCDPGLVRQLLLNLTTNALRVTPPGGLVRLKSERRDGGWRLELEDEGPGLPPGQLERIFERFARFAATAESAQAPAGQGLGLAICRGIVDLHRGKIRAENRTDRSGLRMIVELPAE